MKNIPDIDGLSREGRLQKAAAVIPLLALENDFSALLTRILHRSDKFSALYRYQPLVILSEIERFTLDTSEETFHCLKDEEERIRYICKLITCIEDWRRRLEYACIHTSSLELLKDLHAQIRNHIAPCFSLFQSHYHPKLPDEVGKIWFPEKGKTFPDTNSQGLMRRFFMLLLGAVRMLQKNSAVYREEICSSGMMDPSLAVIVAFLKNYEGIAGRFNERWRQLPYVYLEEMMKATGHPKVSGRVWLALDKSPAVQEAHIPAGAYLPTVDSSVQYGYKLCSDTFLFNTAVEEMDMVVMEKSKERHPESVLNYATALLRTDIGKNRRTPITAGVKIASNILLLREGERHVSMTCKLTQSSFKAFKSLIINVCSAESDAGNVVSPGEALFKILSGSFVLEVTTSSGWRVVDSFHIRFMESEQSFLFQFHLNRDFPALEPPDDKAWPAIRLSVNDTAWLFPYSWGRSIFFESVHIRADVQGVRDIQLYNDLGQIDAKQPFSPFGIQAEKGGWLVFGSYEMACKSATKAVLSFDWQQLPGNRGGLCEYYKAYNRKGMEEITNQSFRVRTEYLQNDEWKQTPAENTHYLFRTRKGMANESPEPAGRLIDTTSIAFEAPGLSPLHLPGQDYFRFGAVRSGFYRLVLTSPEMGFGEKHYRRIFTEVMMHNSRFRKKLPVPEPSIAPLMDALQLSYVAEEACVFAIGQPCPIRISYINPLSTGMDIQPDTTRPVPFLQGPVDEGNLIIALSGTIGRNLIRMYVEMELLQREINHEQLPETYWYFKSGGVWMQLPPNCVLRDDTGHLMYSGGVELQLPHPVSEAMLDDDGLFRICVSVRKNLCNCSSVRNIYVNVAEAEVADEPEEETALPVVADVRQITPLQETVEAESKEEMKARLSERMSHRNRAVLPADYEQMVLQAFPEIAKVKCIPGIDAKKRGQRVVTLALVCGAADEQLPLCEDRLLCKVEDFLRRYASPFVRIDAINPIYEEVTVFCGVSLRMGCSAGTAIADILQRIGGCIAPWFVRKEMPVFGYSFSMRDLYSRIRGSKYVEKLHGIKPAHLTEDVHGAYYLNKGISEDVEGITIAPSEPWAILIPAAHQYVIICTEEEWSGQIGYGDLELGRTFVIA